MSKYKKKDKLPLEESITFQYEVIHYEGRGVLILGHKLPSADISSLAKNYHVNGLANMDIEIPRLLGKYGVAFTKNKQEAEEWIKEIKNGDDQN